jgi:hypothetical protein
MLARCVAHCLITSCLNLTVTISGLHKLVHNSSSIALKAGSMLTLRRDRVFLARANSIRNRKLTSLRVLRRRVNHI